MRSFKRLAIIGNSLPRRCGIATFSCDLQQAMSTSYDQIETSILAMTDNKQIYDYPAQVMAEIHDEVLPEYVAAAHQLNAGGYDVVSLQHEFGIFGGEAGSNIIALLLRLKMPIVTTLHTVLSEPTPAQRVVLQQIATVSARIVVMAEKGRELLQSVYGIPATKIDVVAHGIPDVAFSEPDAAKEKLGFAGKSVVLTFGLLSPNKGIEVMIDAMPAILQTCPNAVYVVLGATHPNLLRDEGEAYRESLKARAEAIGVGSKVVFLDQFVDQPILLDFISMCDVYVTPYLNEAQMTSGTLAYSFGLGKAVVSTPYWHARELLGDGRGCLVPFNAPPETADVIAQLLSDAPRRQAMRERAYASSRSMTWDQTARKYFATFMDALRDQPAKPVASRAQSVVLASPGGPSINCAHLLAMCDDTGIVQHAVNSVPDRLHGYCVDDNARALILACGLWAAGEKGLPDPLVARFAAFVQHAWNVDLGRFRNFMGFSRTWLEDRGSEDSHGRTLWALGVCASSDKDQGRRDWAAALFPQALKVVESFTSPRAWAFTLLGLDSYCSVRPDDRGAVHLRTLLADRLIALLALAEAPDWFWFEQGLSYDNARLSEALIRTGSATGSARYTDAGVRTLTWLMTRQTAAEGHFRPVGTEGFHDVRKRPRLFDQQPVEATATISACIAAWRVTGDSDWRDAAWRVFSWFTGNNDLGVPLIDEATGACLDGLHADRPNQNRGGESAICLLISIVEMRELSQLGGRRPGTFEWRA